MKSFKLCLFLLTFSACLDGGVAPGVCDYDHICEPDEDYVDCPQDCYRSDITPSVLMTKLNEVGGDEQAVEAQLKAEGRPGLLGMIPGEPGQLVERAGNGVCELRENWKAVSECPVTCGNGTLEQEEEGVCLADMWQLTTQILPCGDELCTQANEKYLPGECKITDAPFREASPGPGYCALDCTPMGTADQSGKNPKINVFEEDTCGDEKKQCDDHENPYNCPGDCVVTEPLTKKVFAIGDGICAPGEYKYSQRDCPMPDEVTPCAAICQGIECITECGDGVVQNDEECDDGNKINTDACTNMCENAVCGDQAVQTGIEECDDGNMLATDACTNECKNAVCGDQVVQTGIEECDDGNDIDTDACVTCKNATCGDGVVQEGVEECDDGNDIDGDSCSNMCKASVCGDGQVTGAEECDDGNDIDTDACVACKNATCGDGAVQSGKEECDDGNVDPYDGCSSICSDEYIMFVTPDTVSPNFGGVAGADAICAAAKGKLSGTYVAWVSVNGENASSRLPTGKPLIRPDGQPIVAVAEDLIKGGLPMLTNPINRDPNGDLVIGYAWTGTNPQGTWSGADCQGWTNNTNMEGAGIGNLAGSDGKWTFVAVPNPVDQDVCNKSNYLYCFRTLDP